MLHTFVEKLQAELEDNLLGFYLVGSLSSGDFDLDSDVDFLAVIQEDLGDETISTLEKIMTGMHSMGFYPAQHLEGSFITRPTSRTGVRSGRRSWSISITAAPEPNVRSTTTSGMSAGSLREGGVALLGPPPKTLLPPIPLDKMFTETREALLEILKLLEEQIDEPLTFINSRFGQSFAVLSVCRFLQTLDTGRVESKKAAVKWAKQTLAPEWIGIVDQAWKERQGVRFCVKIRQRAEQKNLPKP